MSDGESKANGIAVDDMLTMSPQSRKRGRHAAALLVSVALLLSCGGGTEPPDRGTYRATITGAVTETTEGPAGFTVTTGEWTLLLLPTEFAEGWQVFLGGAGPRPRAGAVISIAAGEFENPPSPDEATGDVARFGQDLFDLWMASSGQIRITASSESRLSGTFELSAQPFFPEGTGPITVVGTFDAIFIDARPVVRFRP